MVNETIPTNGKKSVWVKKQICWRMGTQWGVPAESANQNNHISFAFQHVFLLNNGFGLPCLGALAHAKARIIAKKGGQTFSKISIVRA